MRVYQSRSIGETRVRELHLIPRTKSLYPSCRKCCRSGKGAQPACNALRHVHAASTFEKAAGCCERVQYLGRCRAQRRHYGVLPYRALCLGHFQIAMDSQSLTCASIHPLHPFNTDESAASSAPRPCFTTSSLSSASSASCRDWGSRPMPRFSICSSVRS